MSTENPVESVDSSDDLDAFSAELFGQTTDHSDEAKSEKAPDPEEDSDRDATPEDTQTVEETDADESDDSDEDTSTDPDPTVDEAKPKKNRFQERIDELTSKAREAERERDAVLARLEALETKQNTDPTPDKSAVDNTPQPTDLNDDGTDKYPLGEFDPAYIRDLTRHTLKVEREEFLKLEAQEEKERAVRAEQLALEASWNVQLESAKERYPDLIEKGQQLVSTFEGIEPAYGEYLTTTIMSMEYGTDVLYYLANNPTEAQKIVDGGARKATVALGRLEAKFAASNEEKETIRPKVSKAPTPPERLNKGSAPASSITPDTDDLDDFEKLLFKKKK